MIELRHYTTTFPGGGYEGDLDEVVAENVSVHLECLSDTEAMLNIQDGSRLLMLRITHAGRSPLRVWTFEESEPATPPMAEQEEPCMCGHALRRHNYNFFRCLARGCGCTCYVPKEER